MKIVLSGHTAYEFWLSSLSAYKPEFMGNTGVNRLTEIKQNLTEFLVSARKRANCATGKLNLLVPMREDRVRIPGVCCQVWGDAHIPSELLVCIGDGLFVVTPELLFLQLARDHTVPELVRMGTELCSLYSYPYNQWNGQLIERGPITSRDDILAFLDQHGAGRHGAVDARRAAAHIVDCTRSPREATLAALLSMPSNMGGQHLTGFLANPQVLLNHKSSRLTAHKYLEVDLYWPDAKVGIEYNSHLHDPNEAAYRDLEKITTLQTMGITIVPLNTEHMNDYTTFSIIIDSLRKRLGVRDRVNEKAKDARCSAHFKLLQNERDANGIPSLDDQAWWQALLPAIEVGC